MMITCSITKDQLDSLRTNPSIQWAYPAQSCLHCKERFQVCIVKLGSQADRSYEQGTNSLEGIIQKGIESFLESFMKTPRKARIRMEAEHFSHIYSGQEVMLPGHCPACQAALVVVLKKQ